MSTAPDPTAEPLYAATVEAHGWSPADLRPPYDLNDVLARSYEKAMVSVQLRQRLAYRATARRNRRPRRVSLP